MSSAPTTIPGTPMPAKSNKYKNLTIDLFTWKSTYVSAGALAGSVFLLLAAKYANPLRFLLHASYLIFGAGIVVEYVGRMVWKSPSGFISSFRPAEYFVLSKDVLDPIVIELVHLVNFLIVEVQRIAFVESLPLTGLAFLASLVGYIAVRVLSLWTLSLIGVGLAFSLPPLYFKFQTEIDAQVAKANAVAEKQFSVASAKLHQHTDKGVAQARVYYDMAMTKVGYNRNMPAVPATPVAAPAEKAAPEVEVVEKVAEPAL
ncbi:putative reticulon-like protein RtnA [Dipodascopsis tothii]|uniref:putative reticulon-like protein RtnA n=1 Tax=Dipodascopsis tothii TaxID=44089 RepID=UPI0034CF4CA6